MEIGISPAALSKKLGGETNLTLDSISNIADVVGATFDVVFRPKNAPRAKQTWESAGSPKCGAGQASGIVEEVRTFGHTNQSVKSFLSGGRRGALRKQETLFKPFAAGNIETPVASGHVEFRCEGLLVANG
jgi:transcriptional regulator with XRE-family HTH domain